MSYDELGVCDERYKLKENKSKEQYRGASDLQVKVSFYAPPPQSLSDTFVVWAAVFLPITVTLMAETLGLVL